MSTSLVIDILYIVPDFDSQLDSFEREKRINRYFKTVVKDVMIYESL